MSSIAVCTIVSKNYLAFARVLAHSLRQHHAELPLYVLVVDRADGCFRASEEPFEVLWLDNMDVPDLSDHRFRHSLLEVLVIAKPLLLGDLLDRGFEHVLFLDADMLVLGSLDPLLEAIRDGSPALTPHLLEPPGGRDAIARELNILLSGVYNGGVVGVSDTGSCRAFLDSWGARLATHCRFAVDRGMYYDQRWLDFAPSHHESLAIVRDPTVNVAHWALPERRLEMAGETLLVNELPCRLFHFSGFEPWHPQRISKWSTRLRMTDLGSGAAIFARYAALLRDAGVEWTRHFPYSFGHFDGGVEIPDAGRLLYRELGERAGRFGDPFANRRDSFLRWLFEPVDGVREPGAVVNRVWDAVYHSRPDVQEAFPDHLGAHRARFLAWTREHGVAEHRIDRAFLDTEAPRRGFRRFSRR
ncbi:MAG: hypothetical protein M3433_01625 [Actinomycetota bacterium]|nr:hypothetical protein [Actinomycetota bacterium]MDQ3647285.1 hypothetical protein [Actinomycetota bacterium]